VEDHFSKFRISDALQSIYKLIWDDFCSQYLEMIKPAYDQEANGSLPIDAATYEATVGFFEQLLQLAHPFMPFITEEIWQQLGERETGASICVAPYPKAGEVDAQIIADFAILTEAVSTIRNLRSSKGLSPRIELPLAIRTETPDRYRPLEGLFAKLANVVDIQYVTEKAPGTPFLIKSDEFFVNVAGEVDEEAELAEARKELEYLTGFRDSVQKKLANEKFVANAKPDVVERERQKLADAEAKIKALEERVK
jgi:valyl-tRNA synthetase